MAGTTHRKDLSFEDFALLSAFRREMKRLGDEVGSEIRRRDVLLPMWKKTLSGEFMLAGLKRYPRHVQFIPRSVFGRLARRAGTTTGRMLDLFFRFSMLALQDSSTPRKKKCLFSIEDENGFLIEARRLTGSFSGTHHRANGGIHL